MVHRILEHTANVSANATDTELDRSTPEEGKEFQVEEIWTNGQTQAEYTVSLRERDLISDLDGEVAPTESERLVVNWVVPAGTDLVSLGTEESGSAQDITVAFLVDEVEAGG